MNASLCLLLMAISYWFLLPVAIISPPCDPRIESLQLDYELLEKRMEDMHDFMLDIAQRQQDGGGGFFKW